MRVIGVIDLKAGKAVHARGGRRELYEPVRSVLLPPEQVGNAAALAGAYRGVPGLTEIYVADLDRIADRGPPSPVLAELLAADLLPAMVDAGVSSVAGAIAMLDAGAARVVVGLETLSSLRALEEIADAVGPERVVFSLDVRGSQVVARRDAGLEGLAPIALVERAVEAGVRSVLLLDLARVGRGAGPALDLVRDARARVPAIEVLTGGGIRGTADLAMLAAAGCDGALLGTALHDGSIVGVSVPETWPVAPGPR